MNNSNIDEQSLLTEMYMHVLLHIFRLCVEINDIDSLFT